MNPKSQELLKAIQFFSQKGWSPATATNYSYRDGQEIMISRSGVDKSQFQETDLIRINLQGEILPPYNQPGIKSSAETGIHLFIYKTMPHIQCVFHTHSVAGTYLSQKLYNKAVINFQDYELLKGIKGIDTHLSHVALPIVANSQNMDEITVQLEPFWMNQPCGFLIAGHGLYSWGETIAEAKRQIETLEFFLEIKLVEIK